MRPAHALMPRTMAGHAFVPSRWNTLPIGSGVARALSFAGIGYTASGSPETLRHTLVRTPGLYRIGRRAVPR
jgi:hypothetical protein